MENWACESNNESCRVQGDFTADRRKSKEYAANVDSGIIENWATDGKGFGLAQWTYPQRKRTL